MKFENVNFPGAFISIICLIILRHSRRDDNEMEIGPTSPSPKIDFLSNLSSAPKIGRYIPFFSGFQGKNTR